MNLAYQELYIVLAGIFRRYDLYDPSKGKEQGPALALHDTYRERDVDMAADLAVPAPTAGSLGIQIKMF